MGCGPAVITEEGSKEPKTCMQAWGMLRGEPLRTVDTACRQNACWAGELPCCGVLRTTAPMRCKVST